MQYLYFYNYCGPYTFIEDEFFAALSCENKSNPKRKKDHEENEDDDKNEKNQKTN